ncbi:MAG: hypothetical protein AAEJ04_02810, partial [Planctomycetota bacterium]
CVSRHSFETSAGNFFIVILQCFVKSVPRENRCARRLFLCVVVALKTAAADFLYMLLLRFVFHILDLLVLFGRKVSTTTIDRAVEEILCS